MFKPAWNSTQEDWFNFDLYNIFCLYLLISVAVKRIREIMGGADIHGKYSGSYTTPHSQPPATSIYHQPPAVLPSQTLPHGVSQIEMF